MTLQAVTPFPAGYIETLWSAVGFTIDASGEKMAHIFSAPKTGSIVSVVFRTSTVSSSQNVRVGLETVSSGNPSGTQYGGSTVGVLASPAANTNYEVTLGTAASATVGDELCVVLQFDGTVGNVQFTTIARSVGTTARGYPYSNHFASAAWTKQSNSVLCASVKYSDGTYHYIGVPAASPTTVGINTGTAIKELGNLFIPTWACAVNGIWWIGDMDGDYEVKLYDGTTALATVAGTALSRGATSTATFERYFSEQTLTAGGSYRLVLKPTTGTSITLSRMTFLAAGPRSSNPLGGELSETSHDGASWTNTATQLIACGPIISQLDDGTGGGGGGAIYHGAMAGGMLT